MFCSQCGQKLIDGASFCTNCGTKILYPEPDIRREMTPEEPAAEDVKGFETREQIGEEAQPAESPLMFGVDEQAAEEYEDYVFAGAASREAYEAQQAREQAGAQPNNGQNAGYGYNNTPNQGYQYQQYVPLPKKSKIAAGVLSIILGDIGVGYFYIGKIGLGLLSVFFCWTGIPAIVGLIQGIIWLCMSDEDFERKYNCRVS